MQLMLDSEWGHAICKNNWTSFTSIYLACYTYQDILRISFINNIHLKSICTTTDHDHQGHSNWKGPRFPFAQGGKFSGTALCSNWSHPLLCVADQASWTPCDALWPVVAPPRSSRGNFDTGLSFEVSWASKSSIFACYIPVQSSTRSGCSFCDPDESVISDST